MEKTITDILDEFFFKYTKLKYRKGEILVRAGDPPPGVFYLKKGVVRQYHISESGDVLALHMYKPGAFFPMMWAINQTPNIYYFEALTPVEAWRAPREAVFAFLKAHPDILFDLTKRLLRGVSGLLQRMEYLVLESAYAKTILLIAYYAKQFGQKDGDGIVLPVPLTHREIAAWIGTTRETASLQIEALKRKGLISYHRRQLVIRDMLSLEREIDKQQVN